MPVLFLYYKSLFLLAISSIVFRCSSQDTLSCGATSFQVSFEPSRPQFSGGGSSSNIGIGSSAKYTFQNLESILRNGQQVCNLTMSGAPQPLMFDPQQHIMRQQAPAPPPLSNTRVTLTGSTSHDDNIRLVITKCENCSNCPQELPVIHRALSRLAIETGLQSLLVIVGHKDSEHVRVVENTVAKFVYMSVDEDPGPLTICELTDTADNDALKSFSKTSVLFVSISFIILMVISLAWLVFYYVQRFRYAHAKDRLQRRLFNAAKKALTRIPTRPVKAGDKELDADCPVCIDPYRTGDIVRMLPCRHIFHKSCVDPWLLEHRTCPMCKSDILKAFGYHVSVNSRRRAQFTSQMGEDSEGGGERRVQSGHHRHNNDIDRLSVDANSTTSESNAFPFPVVSEIHDPFSFTPSTSPQLVQVMHTTNARSFSIIPLTVHSGVGGPYAQQSSSSGTQTALDGISNPGYGATLINASIERHNQTGLLSGLKDKSKPPSHSSGGRLLRAMTSGARRPLKGHVVNLVHVRSRSLSHAQLPLNVGSCPLTGSINDNNPLVACEAVPIEHHSTGQEIEKKAIRPTALFRSANLPNEKLNPIELEEEFPFVLKTKASQYSAQADKRPTTGRESSPPRDSPPPTNEAPIFSQVDQELMAQAHMPNYVPVMDPTICLDNSRQQSPSQTSQFSNTSSNPRLVRGQSARANRTSTAPARCKGANLGRHKKPLSYASFHYSLPPSTEAQTASSSSVGATIGQLPPNPLEYKGKQKQRAVPSSLPRPHFDTISVESL